MTAIPAALSTRSTPRRSVSWTNPLTVSSNAAPSNLHSAAPSVGTALLDSSTRRTSMRIAPFTSVPRVGQIPPAPTTTGPTTLPIGNRRGGTDTTVRRAWEAAAALRPRDPVPGGARSRSQAIAEAAVTFAVNGRKLHVRRSADSRSDRATGVEIVARGGRGSGGRCSLTSVPVPCAI
jgi:hypothetical protein